MKKSISKLILCALVIVLGVMVLMGCQKKKETVEQSEKEAPTTNLSVPAFDEDLNLIGQLLSEHFIFHQPLNRENGLVGAG